MRSVESLETSCQPLWVLVGSRVYEHWADTRISMWGQHGHFTRLTVAEGTNLSHRAEIQKVATTPLLENLYWVEDFLFLPGTAFLKH